MSSQLARDWIRSLYNAVHAPASSAVYPCFTDPALENSGHAYHGQDRERRNAIKQRYDPDNFFRFDNRSRSIKTVECTPQAGLGREPLRFESSLVQGAATPNSTSSCRAREATPPR